MTEPSPAKTELQERIAFLENLRRLAFAQHTAILRAKMAEAEYQLQTSIYAQQQNLDLKTPVDIDAELKKAQEQEKATQVLLAKQPALNGPS